MIDKTQQKLFFFTKTYLFYSMSHFSTVYNIYGKGC